MNLTKRISERDTARTGEKYYKALRGYQQRKDILETMYKSLKSPKSSQIIKMADLGCGPGVVGLYFFNKLKNNFKVKLTFVDINPLMLEAIPSKKNFKIIEQDITRLSLKQNFFDVVVMKQVLDYLPKNLQIKVIKNIYGILDSGGQFILSVLIPPTEDTFDLNNYLYFEREKILNPKTPVKKFILTKRILFSWLSKAGFKNINLCSDYDIPLSVNDFVNSFGLDNTKRNELTKLYKNVIKKDKNNFYKSRIKDGDIELVEKATIVSCVK